MKVSNTIVCLDCDELFHSKVSDCCPFCGSPYITFLCRFFPSLRIEEAVKKSDYADFSSGHVRTGMVYR